MPGILHRDVLAAADWAQEGWQHREYDCGQSVWAFDPHQGVAPDERRWYRATVLRWADQYVTVRFDEARADAPLAWRAGRERTLFRANIRTDLDVMPPPSRESVV